MWREPVKQENPFPFDDDDLPTTTYNTAGHSLTDLLGSSSEVSEPEQQTKTKAAAFPPPVPTIILNEQSVQEVRKFTHSLPTVIFDLDAEEGSSVPSFPPDLPTVIFDENKHNWNPKFRHEIPTIIHAISEEVSDDAKTHRPLKGLFAKSQLSGSIAPLNGSKTRTVSIKPNIRKPKVRVRRPTDPISQAKYHNPLVINWREQETPVIFKARLTRTSNIRKLFNNR